ncbi:MAG: hypothetical protein WKG07_28500 [Hymenobacter sp.]
MPPRPHVWEQLDNSLLLAQNEQYRRRLRTHRWAIAASLLLASLAGGGWWHSQLAPASHAGHRYAPGRRPAGPGGSAPGGSGWAGSWPGPPRYCCYRCCHAYPCHC